MQNESNNLLTENKKRSVHEHRQISRPGNGPAEKNLTYFLIRSDLFQSM